MRMRLAGQCHQPRRAIAKHGWLTGGPTCADQPVGRIGGIDVCGQFGTKRQQKRLGSDRVTTAAFQLYGRMVQHGQFAHVAVMLRDALAGPEQMARQRRMPVHQRLDQCRMQAKRNNQRMFATPLQRMGLAGAEENDAAFGQRLRAVRQVVADLAVLHPEQFIKIMSMQRARALGRQGRPCQVDLRIGAQNIGMAQDSVHGNKLA